MGESVPAGSGWVLVADEEGMPQGWVDVAGWGGPVPAEKVRRFGTVAEAGASARTLLDAALSSPSGRGVVVEDGHLVGTVTADEVLAAMRREGHVATPPGSPEEIP